MAILVSDTFTDTDATSLDAHTPDTAPVGSAWVEQVGNWQITSNRAVVAAGINAAHATIDCGEADEIALSCSGAIGNLSSSSYARDTGIIVRFSTGANFILIGFNAYADAFRIVRFTSGYSTELASTSVTIDIQPTSYAIAVTVSGNTITATLDGANEITATDSQNATSTLHGIYLRDTTSWVDDFVVETVDTSDVYVTANDADLEAQTASLPGASGDPTTYIDGYGGDIFSADDAIMSSAWTAYYNGGVHNDLAVASGQRSLLRFDLSAVTSARGCVRARLHLFHNYAPESSGVKTVYVYGISEANGDWVAGTKNIAAASSGECCWQAKAADGAGGTLTAWAGSEGLSTAGTDYEVTPLCEPFEFDFGSAIGTECVIELDAERVQGWAGATNTNYGIVIWGSGAGDTHFGSSESATPAYRPYLEYIYDGAAPTAYTLTIDQGALTLSAPDIALSAHRRLPIDQAALSLTAPDINLVVGRRLTIEPGALTLSAPEVGMTVHRRLPVDPGVLTLSAPDIGLVYTPNGGYSLTIDPGQLTLSAPDIGLTVHRRLAIDPAQLTLSAPDVGLLFGRRLVFDPGALTLSGADIALIVSRVLAVEQGHLTLAAPDITLRWSGAAQPVTPATRIYVVLAEDRTFVIPAEDRVYVVQ